MMMIFFGAAAPAAAADLGPAGKGTVLAGMVSDGNGNIYVAGTAKAKVGGSDSESTRGRIFIARYSEGDLEAPEAMTVIGDDGARYWMGDNSYNGALTIGGDGNLYLAAGRGSGTAKNLWVYKLSPDLQMLDSASFGASGTDNMDATRDDPQARGIAADAAGNVYIAGDVFRDIGLEDPVMSFAEFGSNENGSANNKRVGFIVRMDPGLNVTACTYMGSGTTGSGSAVNKVICDGRDLYVLGRDSSGKIPAVGGGMQPAPATDRSTEIDAFILRMNAEDLSPTAATYYGGSGSEDVADMKLSGNNLYVLGDTTSPDLDLSEDAANPENRSMYPTGYVMRISRTLKDTAAFAATYFGNDGASEQRIDAFALDVSGGRVYITGSTGAASAVATTDGTSQGRVFMASLKGDLSAVLAASVTGSGNTGDIGRGILCCQDGIILAGTRGPSGYTDTATYQPFLLKYAPQFARAQLQDIAMKEYRDVSYCGLGSDIVIKAVFDANVSVEGAPTLALNIRNGQTAVREAVYLSGSGTNTLLFTYHVKAGDTTGGDRLAPAGPDALQLNGGSIFPAVADEDTTAVLTVPEDTRLASYRYGDIVYVRTAPAHVRSVTAEQAPGAYKTGDVIRITVAFADEEEEPVMLTLKGGSPVLRLNSGGTAEFREFAETAKGNDGRMIFEYTVGAGDAAKALDHAGPKALDLKGAGLADLFGNAADTTLPAAGSDRSISGAGTLMIGDPNKAKGTSAGPRPNTAGRKAAKSSNGFNGATDADLYTPKEAAANAAKVDSRLLAQIGAAGISTTGHMKAKTMTVKFPPVKNALNYRISWRKAGAGSWKTAWTGKGRNVFTLKKLKKKARYEFRIAAYAKRNGVWVRGKDSRTSYRWFINVSRVKVKAGKKKASVSWKPVKKASGYEIRYAEDRSMKNAKVKRIRGASKKKATLKRLKKGKTYYIRARPYQKSGGRTWTGILSGMKKVKIR